MQQGPTAATEGYSAPMVVGTPWIDFRHVTIKVWGLRAQVKAALILVEAAFDPVTRNAAQLPVPNTTATLFVRPLSPAADLEEDPAQKDGEDIWIGTTDYEIVTQRTW